MEMHQLRYFLAECDHGNFTQRCRGCELSLSFRPCNQSSDLRHSCVTTDAKKRTEGPVCQFKLWFVAASMLKAILIMNLLRESE